MCSLQLLAQKMELSQLTALLDVPPSKLDNILQKKGFRKDLQLPAEAAYIAFSRISAGGEITQYLWLDAEQNCIYETSSPDEFTALRSSILTAGYACPGEDSAILKSRIYQREVITIETYSRLVDSTQLYSLKASKKTLPKRKDLFFAEDLLWLDSHEYLVSMFGKTAVKEDLYFFSEQDSTRCSVIFPGTEREAIFVWKDDENKRGISFIIAGGSLHQGEGNIAKAQGFNAWRSRQGIYCGMSLRELETLNGEKLQFFNWNTESAGFPTQKNKGNIDFAEVSFRLRCMNCSFIKVSQSAILDSETATDEMQKIFVTALIVLPSKKKDSSISKR